MIILRLLSYLFIYLLTYSLTHLLIYLLTHLLTHSLTYLLTHSLTYLLTYLFIYSLTHSLTHSLTYLFIHLLTHSLTYLITYFLPTYLLTYSTEHSPSWEGNRFFAASQEIPKFYGTRRFITAFTSASHLCLPWASSIQSIPLHPISWKSILILSSHLGLGLPNGLFPSGFPTKPRIRLS